MRLVLFVTPGFPRPSLTFTVSKFLGLLDKGWDVHVVTPQSNLEDWSHYPDLQLPAIMKRVHVLPLNDVDGTAVRQTLSAFLSHPQTSARFWRRAWRRQGLSALSNWELHLFTQLAVLKPDLLHFEFNWPATRWMFLKELLGCKVTVGLQASEFNYAKPAAFYNILWQNADALHVLGHDIWRRACRLGCPPSLPHRIIPAAIDTDFWQAGNRQHTEVVGTVQRPLRLISVARLAWKKGYEYAFQVVRQLMDQGIHCEYDIIGEGKYAEALYFARQQLGLTEAVQFWGGHSRYQVRDALAHADIFLHTAVAEGFCYAALEAQAMQLPVVCSDADGLPENVAHEQTGFVLPRRNINAMAEKIRLLAENPALRQQMGLAGHRRVQAQFQVAQQIEAFDDFYKQVLAGEPLPGQAIKMSQE
jgi:colanic acid/amylovoran biosynthesis glycosyltransferase